METIWLRRSNRDVPWGFRLIGGCDYNEPLLVQRVTEGSIASTGLSQGDHIVKIGSIDASNITHQQAQEFIATCPDVLQLTIQKSFDRTNWQTDMTHYGSQPGYDQYYSSQNGQPSAAYDPYRQDSYQHDPQQYADYPENNNYGSQYQQQPSSTLYPQFEESPRYQGHQQYEPLHPYEAPSMHPSYEYQPVDSNLQRSQHQHQQQTNYGYQPQDTYHQQHGQPPYGGSRGQQPYSGTQARNNYGGPSYEPRSPTRGEVPDCVQRQMVKGGTKKPFSYIGDDFGDHIKQFKTKNRPRPPAVQLPKQAQRSMDNYEAGYKSPVPSGDGPGQYNSPNETYNEYNSAEYFRQHSGGGATDSRPIQSPQSGSKPQWDKSKSAVYSFLHEEEQPRRRHSPVPQHPVTQQTNEGEGQRFYAGQMSNPNKQSRSFKMVQSMTDDEPARGSSSDSSSRFNDEMTFTGIRESSKNIPSKAFKRLQNMIGVSEADVLPVGRPPPPTTPEVDQNSAEPDQPPKANRRGRKLVSASSSNQASNGVNAVSGQTKGYRDAEIEGQRHGVNVISNRRRGSLGLPEIEEPGTDF